MAILELKDFPTLRDKLNYLETINTTPSTMTDNINNTEEMYFHKNNLSLLIVLMVCFFIISYYLNYISNYNIKKAKSTNTESNVVYIKYSNIQNLSIANFSNLLFILVRALSIIYIVISLNKNGNDLISFFNYFVHIFPSLIFFSVYLAYVRFLIEKFYEIKTKKKDIFFDPTMQFFNILIYIVFFILTLFTLSNHLFYISY